ncbi:MAG TPA: glycosyltransferase family 4 protein [Methanomassiliicoccales archaeon]|nr:glycosyltransferase family 4 protein [Methanomassiliicoccales archaeon]
MRIVQLNPFHYPFMGGIEHRIHHISSILAKEHEVIVVTGQLPGTMEEEEMGGYSVLRLPSKLYTNYNPPHIVTKGILAKLNELEPDVVDFHYRWSGSYRKAMKRYLGKKVFTFHNTFGEGEGLMGTFSTLNDIAHTNFVKGFDRVVCVSEFVRNDLKKRGFSPDLLEAVPNGVDPPAELSGKEGDFILFIGRLVRTKGLDYLLKAMKSVTTPLVIAGGGPEDQRLRKMIKSNGLEDRVKILGRVSEEEKHRLLSECRLFVFPSVWESYGIAAAEAMSYGKAVITTDVGGLPEVVGEAGMLVPSKQPEALSRAINELISDDDRRRELGLRARERAKGYTWNRAAKEMERIYSDVVSG